MSQPTNENLKVVPDEASKAGNSKPARKISFKKRVQIAAVVLLGKGFVHVFGKLVRYRLGIRDQIVSSEQFEETVESYRIDGGPRLIALFHGMFFPVLYRFRNRNICVVTSRSSDGQILARLLEGVGFQTVAGSSSRGGASVTIKLARVVNGRDDAAVAVDGPRGPAWEVKPGIILLGKMTGCPIIPVAATPGRFWQFQSWDRFRLPIPFTRATIIVDTPMHVPADADKDEMERLRVELERRMKELHEIVEKIEPPHIWCLPDRKPRDKQYAAEKTEQEKSRKQAD